MNHSAGSKSRYREIKFCFVARAAILRVDEEWKGEWRGGGEERNIAKSVCFVVKPTKRGNESGVHFCVVGGRKGRGGFHRAFSSIRIFVREERLLSPATTAISSSLCFHTRVPIRRGTIHTARGEKRITKGILCLRSCHPPRPRAHRDFSTKSFENLFTFFFFFFS